MKNLGFGCLRLPNKQGIVDQIEFNRMVDKFLAEGFSFFDTAHNYLNGNSEMAVRKGLTERYPRESYILSNKLTVFYFNSAEDIRTFFHEQLEICGVDYFDYYLMHALTVRGYKKFVDCNAFEVVKQLKAEGKIRHLGISFHDKPAFLEQVLTEHPEIEVVQIQFNYADYDNPSVESGAVYETCRKFDKPIIVMEPVKGGSLAMNLPESARKIFYALGGGSPASYAIRYAASFEGIFMVLSGMSNYVQLEDNISYMKNFHPLSKKEFEAIGKVQEILKHEDTIPCTACHYCTERCPQHILIPELFACLNARKRYRIENSSTYYRTHTVGHGKASSCIGCRQCEWSCPQHLPIVELLKEVARIYD